MRQGFYFDMQACIGCKTCQIACKDKNDAPLGVNLRTVEDYETGAYPAAAVYHYSGACNHCETPACVQVCPQGATYLDEEDGTVQHDEEKCIGCGMCAKACPYGHPQLEAERKVIRRCDACIDLRAAGEQPACVASCPMRALEFGDIEALRAAHPDAVDSIAALPDPSQTKPSIAVGACEAAFEKDFVLAML
ncbi:4Fe-4S dicluster domain-containing protein [Arabiibacter massiliensis]|uniref:4Fe-4S dicluster domain-containing protein n=1 Tax=Arabiibacter massiliensis TaxID=1870985 RepID=UPI0009BAB0F2|nr:4Fe-4S dicluster domain-containing protein [Arabiibacter massiliensis]